MGCDGASRAGIGHRFASVDDLEYLLDPALADQADVADLRLDQPPQADAAVEITIGMRTPTESGGVGSRVLQYRIRLVGHFYVSLSNSAKLPLTQNGPRY